jgi:hypothetical protein
LIRERSCNPFVVPLMSTSPLYPFMRPLLAHPAAGECLRNRTESLRCRRLRPMANWDRCHVGLIAGCCG